MLFKLKTLRSLAQEKQLRNNEVRHVIFDLPNQEDDSFLEKARVDIEGTLPARGLFDNDRN